MSSPLNFQVSSMVSAGPDRVSVSLVQVNATPEDGMPFYGATLNLNLAQTDAVPYDVNQQYTLKLDPIVPTPVAPARVAPSV